MNGLIIKSTKFDNVPDLKEAFALLGNSVHKYNWLLCDYDCTSYPSEKIPMNKDYVWLDGTEFANILKEHVIQFIWGVATAYVKGITIEEVLKYPLPRAEEYDGFWKPNVTLQNPLAEIEIMPLDSSLLLVIANSKDIIERFAKKYPDSQDLAKYNMDLQAKYCH